jgi:hypothetical protein
MGCCIHSIVFISEFLTGCGKLEIFLSWIPSYLMFQDISLLKRLNVDPTGGHEGN